MTGDYSFVGNIPVNCHGSLADRTISIGTLQSANGLACRVTDGLIIPGGRVAIDHLGEGFQAESSILTPGGATWLEAYAGETPIFKME